MLPSPISENQFSHKYLNGCPVFSRVYELHQSKEPLLKMLLLVYIFGALWKSAVFYLRRCAGPIICTVEGLCNAWQS